MPPEVPAAVVGGGMAGLATAYELHRRGIRFLLLEAASRAGGVVLSEEIDGFVVDGGPDSLLVQKPEGITLCEEIGIGHRLVPTKPPRIAYIQRGGVLHALPASSVLGVPTEVGPFLRTSLFSWAAKLRMGAELFVPRRRGESDESVGAFMRRRFGDEATTYLAEPLLAGIHAGDVERLSIRALFPRLLEAERTHGSVLRAFRRERFTRRRDDSGAFRSLPAASLQLGTPVSRLEGDGRSGFRLEIAGGDVVHAQAVVLATPAFVTATIVRRGLPDLARLCDEIAYCSTATIALAFDRAAVQHPLNGSGFVVPKVEGAGILAGSWLSSKWPYRAPEGRVLLRAFAGGARDPDALDRSDAELVQRSLAALRPLLGIAGEPLFTRVYRWRRANAQHEVGHLARLEAIDRELMQHPGVFVTGSGYRGVGIPDCVADGRATGRQVAEWLTRSHP